MRVGVIAKKIGMSSLFVDNIRHPVTLLLIEDCEVINHRTKDKDGYNAVIVGAKNINVNKLAKPQKVFFNKAQIAPKSYIKEFRVSEDNFLEIGYSFSADYFSKLQFVDITGISIGKGFAGSMKRHNFRGLEASHGVSVSHRSHGSTGQRQDPGKVFKNKKMAGHLGSELCTIQNLQVIGTNSDEKLIMIKGSVPGFNGSYVYIRDAIKKSSA